MKKHIAKWTRSLRWKIVSILAPSIWDKVSNVNCSPNLVPRGSTLKAIQHFNKNPITVCEVGVWKGENSLNLFESLNVSHAYLIDFYREYTYLFHEKPYLIPQADQDLFYRTALKNLEPFNKRITWLLKPSAKAITELPENIDFIYIDGDHSYEAVKQDLDLAWSKLAEKGIVAGHDFLGNYNGVISAVHEFAMKHGLPIQSDLYDWWFMKP